jgi:exodeoxyribonuclease V alpha subunit
VTQRDRGQAGIAGLSVNDARDGAGVVTRKAAQFQTVEGNVRQLLFVNEQTGYAVARLEVIAQDKSAASRSGEVTIVGELFGLMPGMVVRVRGQFEDHRTFGSQFRAQSFEIVAGAGVVALERYLADEVKGVGPKLARRIAQRFGAELDEVLTRAPERLREVRGLSAAVIERITAVWRQRAGLRELAIFLRSHGLSGAVAARIYRLYGADALETIKRDPYILAHTIRGVGFRTADLFAERIGIPRESLERVRAAMLYLLTRMAEEGHVYAPWEHLQEQLRLALEVETGLAAVAATDLERRGVAVVEADKDGRRAVYLSHLYRAETELAGLLRRLRGRRSLDGERVKQAATAAERRAAVTLSVEQRHALRLALANKAVVITGGPGTGKTTLLRALLDALDTLGLKSALAAPTGRAARRLAETTGREAKTIHRLLEYSVETGKFIRGAEFPLSADYVIVDEASMIDVELAASLLSALAPESSLVLVGDRDQLPSVGPGRVLADVIACGLLPVIELRRIYRQDRRGQIVAGAHRINLGQMPEFGADASSDFFFLERNAPEEVAATIKQIVSTRLVGNFGLRDFSDIQVLSPMNRGPIGVHVLNLELQSLLNPAGHPVKVGERQLREGDRVIQLRNNYEKQVFNGDIGRIARVDAERGRLEVAFDDHRAHYDLASEADELGLGYVISVHKSQGSQYPAVVLALHHSHYLMLRRNLLYTAISRAERVCVIVGSRSALKQAVRNGEESRRFTRLAERLRAAVPAGRG